MTEASPRRIRWRRLTGLCLSGLLCFLLLGGWFLTTTSFWEWVGWRLVQAVQDRLNAQVSVGRVSGNLLTGMVFSDISISRPQGDILKAQQLEVRLSLLSLLRLEPVIGILSWQQPVITLTQDDAGHWNVANLLKKRPPPPFAQIHLRAIQVHNGNVQIRQPQRHLRFHDLAVDIDLTVHTPGRPQQALEVHWASLGFTTPPYPRLHLNASLIYAASKVQIKETTLSLNDIEVLNLQGEVKNLTDTPELALNLSTPKLAGSRLNHLWPGWPTGADVSAGLQVKGTMSDLQVDGQGAVQKCRWRLHGHWQRPSNGAPEYEMALNFQELSPTLIQLWSAKQLPLESLTHLNGAIRLTGAGIPGTDAKLAGRLDLEPFSYRQVKFDASSLALRLDDPQRHFLVLKLQGNWGRLESELTGQLLPLHAVKKPLTGELKLTASSFNPALASGGLAPPGMVDAKFTGDFQLPASFDFSQARLAGRLQATGRIKEYAFQELSAVGSWEQGGLRLDLARLVSGGLRAEAQGRLSTAGADLRMALNLEAPGPGYLLPADLKGRLRLNGEVKGPWNSLAYQLAIEGDSVSWGRLRLGSLQGRSAGFWSQSGLTISQFAILARRLESPLGSLARIEATGQTREQNLLFDLKARQNQGTVGSLSGAASWRTETKHLTINTLRLGPAAAQLTMARPATLTMTPGRFELSPLRLQYQDSVLTLGGRAAREDVSLQLQVDKLRLRDLARLWPSASLLHGIVSAQATINGPASSPIMKGSVSLTSGQLAKFRFDSLQTDWLYQDRTLSLRGRWEEKPGKNRLTWQGSVPLGLSLYPWSLQPAESGLNMRAESENLTLSLLSLLIPGVSAADGPLNLQVQASGSVLRPSLRGALHWGPSSLTISHSGAPLALEPGELLLEGDRLLLPKLLFHSGDGQGVVKGNARLDGLLLQGVQTNLQMKDVLIIKKEGSTAVADGQVSLSGSWPAFQSEGRLLVKSGTFRLSFFRSERNKDIVLLPRTCPLPVKGDAASSPTAPSQVEKSFGTHIVIDIPGNLWLRDKDLQTEIQGQIRVIRHPSQPKYLAGSLKARRGGLTISDKVFTLDKATLNFPGEPNKPAILDARATRQIDEVMLSVAASGPVDNLRTRLESSPPLPPRDLLSLLIFDHLADKMTREEYVTVTQKAMGLIGGLTAQRLKALLGGRLPFFGEVTPSTSQEALGLGKKVSKNITISYERKLNPLQGEDVNQIRLDYKIRKYFSAETQLGRKNSGGDLFFNLDF